MWPRKWRWLQLAATTWSGVPVTLGCPDLPPPALGVLRCSQQRAGTQGLLAGLWPPFSLEMSLSQRPPAPPKPRSSAPLKDNPELKRMIPVPGDAGPGVALAHHFLALA